jgi:hypothetical protein
MAMNAPSKPLSTSPRPDAPGNVKKVVLNLGKQKRGRIRELRRGEGALMNDVQREIARLRETGVLKKDGPVVVFLVREKAERGPFPMFG